MPFCQVCRKTLHRADAGIYLKVPTDLEGAVSGAPIKVTVFARKSPNASPDRFFAVAYSTLDAGNSGWKQFKLTDTLAPYSLIYQLPSVERGDWDFVGILPDLGGGGVVEIAAIAVDPNPVASMSTAFYTLAVERVPLPPVSSQRGAIAQVGDLLLYAAGKGRLYAIANLGESVSEVDLAIPLRHKHALLERFAPRNASTYDIAAEPSPLGEPGHYDLYASYLGIDDESECHFLTLSKAVVAVSGDDLNVIAGWEGVFRAEPCVPFASMVDLADETGGRIDFNADGIILTTGIFESDPQADDQDYGKIIRLDRTTFNKRTISKGHRNPQGLFIDSDGTIFETEHGPRGGDEVNVIEDGKNYGFPVVTYGTTYGKRLWCAWRKCDPDAPPESQGRHLGFEQPIYAFAPSIGISQIIKVVADRQFPIWQGDLLVASLATQSLYRLHLHEQRVIVVEPIALGPRLRDMIELDDGRIVILTDERALLIVSNGDKGGAHSR